MFVPLLLVICYSCLVEGQQHSSSKTFVKTAPTFFANFSSTESGCSVESDINIDHERRKTRNIINNNYKLRPHQCGGPGWTRAYYLNMNNPKSKCPANWTLHNEVRACGRRTNRFFGTCNSLVISITNIKYSIICGRIHAYQNGLLRGFFNYDYTSNIDHYYLSGITLTHGQPGNRHHIWSFVGAQDETTTTYQFSCPGANTTNTMVYKPPPFVGTDYFCDTGAHTYKSNDPRVVYKEDPLWDGEGCGNVSTCCSFNNPPWFYKTLKNSTRDDLELRLCGYFYPNTHDVLVYYVEIYII